MATTTASPRARRAHAHVAGSRAAPEPRVATATRASTAPSATPPQPDHAGHVELKRSLDVVRPSPKRTGLWRTRLVLIAPMLCVLSLLAVAGAQAVLTEGQVRLTNLQAEVSAAQTKRFDLELQIALEEQPSAVIAAARAQGMIVPSVINEIPAVNIGLGHPKKQTSRAKGNGSGLHRAPSRP